VMGSAAIYQGQLTRKLPEAIRAHFERLETDAQRALQFARSTPGLAVALVGMSQTAHVEENLRVAQIQPSDLNHYMALFQ
jgi:aryl-alcohol dehydrogenase-like predicted oxidoreductase